MKVATDDTIIVDGGVLSNFPMWLFDGDAGKRERPVIGLKLSRSKEEVGGHEISNALHLFEALFSTMKNAHDERYISREHEKDVVFIPVEGFSATQFNLEDETKAELMKIGRERTLKFLEFW